MRLPDLSRCFPRRSSAFTLVELLVVIGIIAVLISILLPALNKARQASQITACASSMHQLDLALRLYANINQDQIPIGFGWGDQWHNYSLFNADPTSKKYQLLGAVYQAGLIQDPKCFYCPNETETRWMYNQPNNPWPPQPLTSNYTRVGYGTRPEVDWYLNDRPKNQAGVVLPYPRLTKLKNKALLAEVMIPKNLTYYAGAARRHAIGMNVAYADGSVRFVRVEQYKANYQPRVDTTVDNLKWLSTVWADLDKW